MDEKDKASNPCNNVDEPPLNGEQIEAPRSIVAGTSRPKTDLLESKCFNIFYDGLTIFISIADVTTDVLVLLSYYNDDRTTFFVISLVILLLAQFGYVMVFLFAFSLNNFLNTITHNLKFYICKCSHCDFERWSNAWNSVKNKCCNCCHRSKCTRILGDCIEDSFWLMFALILLAIAMIFGHLVAFLMYFGENEDSKAFKFLHKWFGIEKRKRFGNLEKHLSPQTKFAIEKINKHGVYNEQELILCLIVSFFGCTACFIHHNTLLK